MAARLRLCQAALRRHLSRAGALAEVVRAVNASVDPERVAESVVVCMGDWIPAPAWAVIAADEQHGTRLLGERALPSEMTGWADTITRWVLRSGEPFAAADLSVDSRTPGAPGVAAMGFPLVCRGGTMSAATRCRSPTT